MEQIFSAIPSLLNTLDANAAIDQAVVFAAWTRCAGELLDERTTPLEFSENRLTIAVQDAMWRRHLEELSSQMLVKINAVLGQGTVRFIEFRVHKKAVGRKLDKTNRLNDLPTQVTPSLMRAAEAIGDINLRERFLSTAAVYLAQQNKIYKPQI